MLIIPIPLALFGGGIGYGEIILILFVALLVFGRRLPEVGRSLGEGLNEFKRGLRTSGGGGDAGGEDDAGEKKKEAGTSESPPGPPAEPDDSEKKDDLAG